MVYVASDIHGCFDELTRLLQRVKFTNNDQLIILGDIVDRGKKSLEMLNLIFNSPNIILLMGNHEQVMIDWFEHQDLNDRFWLEIGGDKTLNQLKKMPASYINNIIYELQQLPLNKIVTVNNYTFILAHACIADLNDTELCLWGDYNDNLGLILPHNHFGIVGHTPTVNFNKTTHIKRLENIFFIDGGGCFGYNLNLLRLDDLQTFTIRCGGTKNGYK